MFTIVIFLLVLAAALAALMLILDKASINNDLIDRLTRPATRNYPVSYTHLTLPTTPYV